MHAKSKCCPQKARWSAPPRACHLPTAKSIPRLAALRLKIGNTAAIGVEVTVGFPASVAAAAGGRGTSLTHTAKMPPKPRPPSSTSGGRPQAAGAASLWRLALPASCGEDTRVCIPAARRVRPQHPVSPPRQTTTHRPGANEQSSGPGRWVRAYADKK